MSDLETQYHIAAIQIILLNRRTAKMSSEETAQSTDGTGQHDQHSHDLSGGGYTDIRKHSAAREFRRCPECGHEWLHKRWRRDGEWKEGARTSNCPNCRLVPLLDRLAPEYASHVVKMEPDDPGVRPSPTLRYVGKAMAYDASETVGYAVNALACESYIKIHLPEWHWLHRDEHPSQRYDSGRINEKYVREVESNE